MNESINIFWFRRDLRLNDNAGLFECLKTGIPCLSVFIFDAEILAHLHNQDSRVQFIHERLAQLKRQLQEYGSDLVVLHGKPTEIWKAILAESQNGKGSVKTSSSSVIDVSHRSSFEGNAHSPWRNKKIQGLYLNHDYEPYARDRDKEVKKIAESFGTQFFSFKDQVIFEKEEVLTDSQRPYTVYTPYKKKWLSQVSDFYLKSYPVDRYLQFFLKIDSPKNILDLRDIGFSKRPGFEFPAMDLSAKMLKEYKEKRDFPYLESATSRLGLHLRFGTLSVRELAREGLKLSDTWLSELVWREFFMQILWHFPYVEKNSFRPQYDQVAWRKSPGDFAAWSEGRTGYPIVDAGIRELLATGHMHNRVRMIVASFLTKHLLIHWYEGERFFAQHLLDYDLASNNGNWQWAAGTGCDAAPYFRVFNPEAQQEKFDPKLVYIKKWVPEYGTSSYPKPIVDHRYARERCLKAFQKALGAKT